MDGTCITLMAFQKGIRISKATLQQSFPDKGSKKIQYQTFETVRKQKVCIHARVSVSFSHTQKLCAQAMTSPKPKNPSLHVSQAKRKRKRKQ